MKACVYSQYGPPNVMSVADVKTPEAKNNEVRIKVSYTALTAGDRRIRASDFPKGMKAMGRLAIGVFKPRNKILGLSFSGVIDQVGDNVTEFKVGDRVCCVTGMKMGACAEYVTMQSTKKIVIIPDSVDLQDAAAVIFGGTTSLFYLREKGKLAEGQKVLINGASGALGTNAIQIAKIMGANVAAITSTKNIDLVKNLGADKVIDYTSEDIYKLEEKFDLIFDAVGNLDLKKTKTLLNADGKVLLIVADLKQQILPDKQTVVGVAPDKKEYIVELVKLLEEKKLEVVTGNVFKAEEIVKAHELADSGHKVGNILIKFD